MGIFLKTIYINDLCDFKSSKKSVRNNLILFLTLFLLCNSLMFYTLKLISKIDYYKEKYVVFRLFRLYYHN